MHAKPTWQHWRAALLLAFLLPLCLAARAAVPHEEAVPAYAEEQTILQFEKATPEPGLGSTDSGRRHIDRHYVGRSACSPRWTCCCSAAAIPGARCATAPSPPLPATILLVVPLLIFGFYRAVGPARLDRPETGRKIQRFSAWDRLIHWATAYTFIALALTGLIIMYGKKLLLPLMGHDAFSWVAIISKYLHNFVGPLFIVCSVLMFFTFLRENLFRRWDWNWIKKGGGLVSHKHVPAGYFNAGEKMLVLGRRRLPGHHRLGLRPGAGLRQLPPDALCAAVGELPARGRRGALHGRQHGPYLHRHLGHAGRLPGDAAWQRRRGLGGCPP